MFAQDNPSIGGGKTNLSGMRKAVVKISWQEGFGGVSADKDIPVGVKLMPVPHQTHHKGGTR